MCSKGYHALRLKPCNVCLRGNVCGLGEEFTAKRCERVAANSHDRDFFTKKVAAEEVEVTRAQALMAVVALASLTGKRPSSYVGGKKKSGLCQRVSSQVSPATHSRPAS